MFGKNPQSNLRNLVPENIEKKQLQMTFSVVGGDRGLPPASTRAFVRRIFAFISRFSISANIDIYIF